MNTSRLTLLLFSLVILCSCASPQRMGMVKDPKTGLQYGSMIQRNLLVDSSQFANKGLKLRIRNTSGDSVFGLYEFRNKLEGAYSAKGYRITNEDDFGILLDINIVYSGAATTNLIKEFGLGAAVAGGAVGSRNDSAGAAIGTVVGATLGIILGSYITEDTYIVIADVNFLTVEPGIGKSETTVTFSASEKKITTEDTGFKPFRNKLQTGVFVYAGGTNTPQSKISNGVRNRFIRILSDII